MQLEMPDGSCRGLLVDELNKLHVHIIEEFMTQRIDYGKAARVTDRNDYA